MKYCLQVLQHNSPSFLRRLHATYVIAASFLDVFVALADTVAGRTRVSGIVNVESDHGVNCTLMLVQQRNQFAGK